MTESVEDSTTKITVTAAKKRRVDTPTDVASPKKPVTSRGRRGVAKIQATSSPEKLAETMRVIGTITTQVTPTKAAKTKATSTKPAKKAAGQSDISNIWKHCTFLGILLLLILSLFCPRNFVQSDWSVLCWAWIKWCHMYLFQQNQKQLLLSLRRRRSRLQWRRCHRSVDERLSSRQQQQQLLPRRLSQQSVEKWYRRKLLPPLHRRRRRDVRRHASADRFSRRASSSSRGSRTAREAANLTNDEYRFRCVLF